MERHDLKIEKLIAKPATDVFRAISEGRLFMNCGADSGSMEIDFKVGGRYKIEFLAYGMTNGGEFLEIIPNQKIVFTWSQDGNDNADTKVTVELKPQGEETLVSVYHVGFKTKELANQHHGGWTGGLNDLGLEITEGKLRFYRFFNLSVHELYELCKTQERFLGLLTDPDQAKITEMVVDQKIVFTLTSHAQSKVTLTFEAEDGEEKESWLELIHEGLNSEELQKSQRAAWESLLSQIAV